MDEGWLHPPGFLCPISKKVMHDPCILSDDGFTYERCQIDRWLMDNNTSPVTGARLVLKDLFSNHALRHDIEAYSEQVVSVRRRAIREVMEQRQCCTNQSYAFELVYAIGALIQFSLVVSAGLNCEVVLQRLVEQARILVEAEAASVYMVDSERAELYSTMRLPAGKIRNPFSTSIAGRVAATGVPIFVRDVDSDHRFNKAVDTRVGFRTRQLMCVPLKAGNGRMIGVVQLMNKRTIGATPPCEGFTVDDAIFLQTFASQAATALSNAFPDGSCHTPPCKGCTDPEDDVSSFVYFVRGCARALTSIACCVSREHSFEEVEPVVGRACSSLDDGDEAHLHQPKLQEWLDDATGSWHFDAFALSRRTSRKPLSMLFVYLFERHGLIEHFSFDSSKLWRFCCVVERCYDSAQPYHNALHAASVVHMMNALLEMGGLLDAAAPAFGHGVHTRQLVRLACLLAALVHDVDHPGVNNAFLVKTSSERARRFNDQHVNENHHIAAALALLRCPQLDFLDVIASDDVHFVRQLLIEMVLATDMAVDGDINKALGTMLDSVAVASSSGCGEPAFEARDAKEATLLLKMGIKAADLGHLAMPWGVHLQWVKLLETEFFAQGDMELAHGLPASFLMDREKPGASQTQTGFFAFVVVPFFRQVVRAAPSAMPAFDRVMANYEQWRVVESSGVDGLEAKRVEFKSEDKTEEADKTTVAGESCGGAASTLSGSTEAGREVTATSWQSICLANGEI